MYLDSFLSVLLLHTGVIDPVRIRTHTSPHCDTVKQDGGMDVFEMQILLSGAAQGMAAKA